MELLVRLHLAGFMWGDCSLSNTLFRLDAGAFAAYLDNLLLSASPRGAATVEDDGDWPADGDSAGETNRYPVRGDS